MGSGLSVEESTVDNDKKFPESVKVEELLAKNKDAQRCLYKNLAEHGYCPIKVNESIKMKSSKLSEVAFEYFTQESDIKNLNLEKDKNNIGYVLIPGVREYMKLRPTDPTELWPSHPLDFKLAFDNFFETYAQIAFTSFYLIAEYQAEDNQPLITPDRVKIIEEFLHEKSSVSMIKYFTLNEPKEVCSLHTDTGILTFITRTSRPSLEIYDKGLKEFIKVEEFLEEGDVIVFVGEKVPLFACSEKLTSTPHRVNMQAGGERMSIAFLLDVAK